MRKRGLAEWGLVLLLGFSPSPLAAETPASGVRGRVENGTTSQPAAGDEVFLVRSDGQMGARTITDGQGAFTLPASDPPGRQLVRVLHQGVSYEGWISPGSAAPVQVFDAAESLAGLRGSIAIFRISSPGNTLQVSEMYDLSNQSYPPRTLSAEKTFEIYLPKEAAVDSILAAGPTGITQRIGMASLGGGRHAINFPLRPGDTRIAVNYHVPYETGHFEFHPRLTHPVRQLAVMFPASMDFVPKSASFHPLFDQGRARVEAATEVGIETSLAFEVSGRGVLPPLSETTRLFSSSPPAPPLKGTERQSRSLKWLIGFLSGVLILIGLLRRWPTGKTG